MKPAFKKKLIKALRSGKYRKTKGCLRSRDNCYCVLGVVCDLVKPGKVVARDDINSGCMYSDFLFEIYHGKDKIRGSGGGLSDELKDITGIDIYEEGLLAKRNDSNNESFSRLADYIEKNF